MATATKCASPRYWHKKWPEPMAQSKPKPDDVRYYRPEEIPGMVLGEAHFTDFSFEPHFHLDYHIGLIAKGAQRQRFAGQNGVLAAGRISIMPPGEVHTGTPENSNAYSLRTFRVAPALLDSLAAEFSGHRQTLALRPEIIESPHLSQHLTALHQQMTLNTGAAVTHSMSNIWPRWSRCLWR